MNKHYWNNFYEYFSGDTEFDKAANAVLNEAITVLSKKANRYNLPIWFLNLVAYLDRITRYKYFHNFRNHITNFFLGYRY